jgi:hypothetical protein
MNTIVLTALVCLGCFALTLIVGCGPTLVWCWLDNRRHRRECVARWDAVVAKHGLVWDDHGARYVRREAR